MLTPYTDAAPTRETLEATPGLLVLEFGSNTCGICEAAGPLIAQALANSSVAHIRVQDGKGRRLGRHYSVKLWPTLILIRDGKEVTRVVRPTSLQTLQEAFGLL